MKYTPKSVPPERINRSTEKPIKFVLKSLSILSVILIAFYICSYFIPPVLTALTPKSVENKLGEILFSAKFKEKTSAPDKTIQEVWSKLKAVAPIDLKDNELYILESSEENAFAAPGGKVFLTTKFLKNSTSLNERIFVIGHELGHQHYRHPVKSVYTSLFSAGIASLISGSDNFSGLMFKATSMSFSRRQETEADMFALDLVQKISGNAKGAFDFFKRINEKYGMLENLNGGIFATHPLSKERIDYLEKECSHKFGQDSCS